MAFRRFTSTRRSTPRRAVRSMSRRRVVHSVISGSLALAAPSEIDAFDLFGVVVPTDVQGATHVKTWGKITVIPDSAAAADVFVRIAFAARKDSSDIANLASASLAPLRDFTAAGAAVADRSWRSRWYASDFIPAGARVGLESAGTLRPRAFSATTNWACGKLGTLDAGEGWYLYMVGDASEDLTVYLDLQTLYMLP